MTHAAALLVALSIGAYLAATARTVLSHFGAQPASLLLPAAGAALLLALATTLPAPPPRRPRRWLLLLPPLLLLAADPLLALAAHLPLLPEQLRTGAILAWLLAGLPTLRRAAQLHSAPPPALLLAAALGLLAVLLPPLAATLLAAVGLAVAAQTDRRPPRDTFDLRGAPDSLPVMLATAALGILWISTRAALSPTVLGAALVACGAAAGAALGRLLSVTPLWPRLLLAGAGVLGVWLGWGALWVAARPLPAGGPETLWLALACGGLAGGALLGWSWGRQPAPLGWVGLAAGLGVTGALEWGAATAPGLVGLIGAATLLLGARPAPRLAGLALTIAAAASLAADRAPSAALAVEGRFTQHRTADAAARSTAARSGMREAAALWSARGLAAVRAPEALWSPQRPDRADRLQIEIDGLVAELPSRADSADALAGHLAGALAPERGTLLLLGDDLGTALIEVLRYNPGRVRVAVPFPEIPRAVAPLDPARERAWLDGAVQLEPLHPEALLRLTPTADAIVEISRAPWADSGRPLLRPDHIDAVARRLTDDGLYILALHLLWHDAGQPEAVVRSIAQRFAHVQLWMPPSGADTLLIVASQQPPSLARLLERAEGAQPGLSALGLRTPVALASLAISSRDDALGWAGGARTRLLDGLALPAAMWSRPLLHLSGLSGHVTPPEVIWGPLDEAVAADLVERQGSREKLLSLLGRAAAGDMQGVFDEALQLRGDREGVAALDPLIEPHLRDAREELRAAITEGPDSPRWEGALRYATTAKLLSPSSPRPHLALGEIAMRRRDLDQARQHYADALTRSEGNLTALTSLAQIAHIEGDSAEEERLLREAVAGNARAWPAHQNLGTMLLLAGRTDEAEESLRVAVSLSEGRAEAPLLALTEIYLATGQATRALVEAERATQLSGSAQSWFLRGRAHYDLEQLDLAAEDYQRAVLTDPSHAVARAAYGHVRAVQGRLDEAAEALRLALQVDPDNDAARELLRRIQREQRAEGPPPPAP